MIFKLLQQNQQFSSKTETHRDQTECKCRTEEEWFGSSLRLPQCEERRLVESEVVHSELALRISYKYLKDKEVMLTAIICLVSMVMQVTSWAHPSAVWTL